MSRYFLAKQLVMLFLCVPVLSLAFTQALNAEGEVVAATTATAADEAKAAKTAPVVETSADLGIGYAFDNAVLFFCAVLVLFMQAGFAMVEAGLNAAKNVVNILYKNLMDLAIGVILFFLVGFAIMYPASYYPEGTELNPYFNFSWKHIGIYTASADRTFSPQADFFFQVAFAATAATIVSGAVAGRMQFKSYLIYSAVITALIYPVSGYWKWGSGWLMQFGEQTADGWTMGFQDFAGSAVVHAVGGFAGLAGAILLGARKGRYTQDGKSVPMPGHNLSFAALGVFILWVGWYGFNPGSQLAFQGTGDIDATMLIAVNTTLAAGAGAVMATFLSWIQFRKPDLSMTLNGSLGGLVGITAGCDCFTNGWSIVVGLLAGVVVTGGILLLDKMKIDDPVGAFPVHGMCGIWGCMAIGILPNTHLAGGDTTFLIQSIGTASICGWSFATMFTLFGILKLIGILRVSEAEESVGLDISEHGMQAYPPSLIGEGLSSLSPAYYGIPKVETGVASATKPGMEGI